MNSDSAASTSRQTEGEHTERGSVLRAHVVRYDLISIILHWLIAVVTGVQLVLAWYLVFRPEDDPRGWDALFRLHIAVGFAAALLVVAMLIWRLFHPAPHFPQSIPSWRRSLGQTVNLLLYAALLFAPFSGYMAAEFSGQPMQYPGLPLPAWGWHDPALHQVFAQLHRGMVWALAGLVGIHVVIVIAHTRRCEGFIARMLPFGKKPQTPVIPLKEQLAEQENRRLARRFRLLGWFGFWGQLGLGLIGLLLLMVVASSSHYSVQATTGLPGVFGAYAGIIVLVATMLAFFYCTRVARGFVSDIHLSPSRQRLLKFLGLLSFTGFVGMAAGILGAASSIALLVAKTVTQPPGIAITDPSRIIRALDVFVLLANFNLLVAHFIGTLLALWLTMYAFRHGRPSLKATEDAVATGAARHPVEHAAPPDAAAAPEPAPVE